MTEKEFENLKVGDKVWYRRPSADCKTTEVVCREVRQKSENRVLVDCLTHNCHCGGTWRYWHEGSLTKSEEWEEELRGCEENAKYAEMDLVGYKKSLAHAKSELAKARAEKEVKQKDRFFVDFNDGVVREQANGIIPQHVEPHLCGLFSSLQEAYVALADYHKRKYEEALVNSGNARFVISCGNKICLVQDLEKAEGNMVWVSHCDGFSLYVPKENVFSTRQEAEAELKRRLRS